MGGLVFGVLHNVFPFFILCNLFLFLFDLFAFVPSTLFIIVNMLYLFLMKYLLPIKQKSLDLSDLSTLELIRIHIALLWPVSL